MQEIDVRRSIRAESAVIFRLLDDSTTWPTWTPIESCVIDRPAGADGLGELRTFRTGRVTVHEEIVLRVPDRRLDYVLLSGLAVRNYRAGIELTPSARSTTVRWHTTFEAKVPATGWLYRRALEKATREFVDGLEQAAERSA